MPLGVVERPKQGKETQRGDGRADREDRRPGGGGAGCGRASRSPASRNPAGASRAGASRAGRRAQSEAQAEHQEGDGQRRDDRYGQWRHGVAGVFRGRDGDPDQGRAEQGEHPARDQAAAAQVGPWAVPAEEQLDQDDWDRDAEDRVVDQVELRVIRVHAEEPGRPAGRAVQVGAGQALQGQALLDQAVGDAEQQQVEMPAAGAPPRLAQEQRAAGVDRREDQQRPEHPQWHRAQRRLGDHRRQHGQRQRGPPVARPRVGHPWKGGPHDRPVDRDDQRGEQRQLTGLERAQPHRIRPGRQLPGHHHEPGRRDEPHPAIRRGRAGPQPTDHPDIQNRDQEDQDLVGPQGGGVRDEREDRERDAGDDARDEQADDQANRPLLRQ